MKQLIAIALLFLATLTGCASPEPQLATVEAFSEAFRTAYDAGDEGEVSKMVDWTNVDGEMQRLQLALLTLFLGEDKVNDISIVPFDPDTPNNPINGREVELNIAPTHMFTVTHSGNAGFEGGPSSGTSAMPIGQKNGRYYFCGWSYKDSPK